MIRFLITIFFKKSNKLRKYYEAQKRAKNIQNAKSKIPPYLKSNDFKLELNYKLWVTKGARFKASERCEEMDRRSTKIVGWLSAYLVIFSVLNICNFDTFQLPENVNNFMAIALSIMILVFSQFEYAMGYSVRAKEYHSCALEISVLYDKLRLLKERMKIRNNTNTQAEENAVDKIIGEYEQILFRNKNHQPIDYERFQIDKPLYFNLSKMSIRKTKLKYFFKVRFVSYFCIYGLPILYLIFVSCFKTPSL